MQRLTRTRKRGHAPGTSSHQAVGTGKLPGIRQIIAVGTAKGGIGKSPARTSKTKVSASASS